MSKINILIVGMSPETGGIENFVMQVVSGMDADRFHFDVLTFCSRCAYEEELTQLGCRVFHATRRGKNPIKNYLDQRRFFAHPPKSYDFVWLHLSSASDLKTILFTKKFTKAKVACHCHGTDFESKDGAARKLHLYLHKKNRPKLVENTDIHLACSTLAGDWLYGDIGEKLTLVPNGIDIDAYKFSHEKRKQVRQSLEIQNNNIVIGHVGRLTKVKNQTYLIDVFVEFRKRYSDAVLIIVGVGELEADLREKVNRLALTEQVLFLGFRQDISDLLQAFDVFLLPSFSEGLPITVIEAQACGLPCLISNKITQEVALTDIVCFLPITQPPTRWADKIDANLNHSRDACLYQQKVIESGYSAQSTINKLSNIFGGKE